MGVFALEYKFELLWEIPRLNPFTREDYRRLHRISTGVNVAVEGAGDHVFVGLDDILLGVVGFQLFNGLQGVIVKS